MSLNPITHTCARPLRAAAQAAACAVAPSLAHADKVARLGVRCIGLHESGSPQAVSRGACTETDTDGDQIFATYESRIANGKPIGTHVYVGGTGKYAGITGRADFSVMPVKSSDGTVMFSVPHRASWKLP